MPNILKEVVNHKNMTDFYKCHFCPRNIKLYNIDKHFKIFHKFGHSDIEYYCEFCDSQEVFLTRDDLLEHIHSAVQHMAEKAIPEQAYEHTYLIRIGRLDTTKKRSFVLPGNSPENRCGV